MKSIKTRNAGVMTRSVLLGLSLVVLSLMLCRPAVVRAATTLTVNSTFDDGTGTCTTSKCTLRDAILNASAGGTITFSLPANSAITLTNGQLLINKSLTISGPGASLLTVQRSAASSTPAFGIFEIASGVNATISGLTVANGNASGQGGGIANNTGTVNITNCTISGNTAGNFGGGIANSGGRVNIRNSTISGNKALSGDSGSGGGIFNLSGTVGIRNSTISGNTASFGGGIFNRDAVIITNSTISGNSSGASGGGIGSVGGTLTLTNSTISGNTANVSNINGGGGGVNSDGAAVAITNSTISGNSANKGGGIYDINGGVVSLTNTIIALNTAAGLGPDVFGSFNSQGFNLIGKTDGSTGFTVATDQRGTVALPIDPMLGPLQDNGGPTKTQALLSGSKAIDKGIAAPDAYGGGPITTDQRGFTRPVDSPIIADAGDGSDIGAYEVQPGQLDGCRDISLVVNNTSDGGAGSLRAVVANACGGSTITFAANIRGAINLTSGELLINKNLTINGPGANLLSVQRSAAPGTPNFRIFNIAPASVNATISGLTIANGNAFGPRGGGIRSNATLTIASCAISGNLADNGGGIYNDFGTLTITNSTISGNTVSNALLAGSGGGIFNQGGTVVIINSTISGNTARGPGNNSDNGGGIITNVGMVFIGNSTISGNLGDNGGGIRNINGGTVTSSNTIIALNTSPSGPDVNGTLTSAGFNLIGNNSGATISPAQFSDQIGVTPAQLNLGPLQDNGGPTQTHALLSGSFAIDKGGFIESPSTDQRGFPRPFDDPAIPNVTGGDGSDIGAYEYTPDCLFNWAERNYPSLFAPAGARSNILAPYYYRFYAQTNAYLGTSSADNHVYYLGSLSNNAILDVGALSGWLSTAGCQ